MASADSKLFSWLMMEILEVFLVSWESKIETSIVIPRLFAESIAIKAPE